jgi:hypothetical protein
MRRTAPMNAKPLTRATCWHTWLSRQEDDTRIAHTCMLPTDHSGPHRCGTQYRGLVCGEEKDPDA